MWPYLAWSEKIGAPPDREFLKYFDSRSEYWKNSRFAA